jgi:hypothetical protein
MHTSQIEDFEVFGVIHFGGVCISPTKVEQTYRHRGETGYLNLGK